MATVFESGFKAAATSAAMQLQNNDSFVNTMSQQVLPVLGPRQPLFVT
jgi:hypothetical protein